MVTPKPAINGHLKTGHLNSTPDDVYSAILGLEIQVFCPCGNPRVGRISISAVSFHRLPFLFLTISCFCAVLPFFVEKFRARIA